MAVLCKIAGTLATYEGSTHHHNFHGIIKILNGSIWQKACNKQKKNRVNEMFNIVWHLCAPLFCNDTQDRTPFSFKLNIWDVGGQKSLRSYWRNYFECTDGLVWVVDSADKRRMTDCKKELHALLQEEVRYQGTWLQQIKMSRLEFLDGILSAYCFSS